MANQETVVNPVAAGLAELAKRGDRRPKFVVTYTQKDGSTRYLPVGIALDAVNRAKRATTQEGGRNVTIWTFSKEGEPYSEYHRPEPKIGSRGGKVAEVKKVNESGLSLEDRRIRKNLLEDFGNVTHLFRKNEEFAQANLRVEWAGEFVKTFVAIGGTKEELAKLLG